MLNWKAKTDEELDKEFLLQPGAYPAEVLEAEIRRSKKGGMMLALKLAVYDVESDKYVHVYDHISPDWFHHKFKHFFFSAGKGDLYEKETLPDASLIQSLQCSVELDVREKHQYKDADTGEMKDAPAQNVVKDYLTADIKAQFDALKKLKDAPVANEVGESDLPF